MKIVLGNDMEVGKTYKGTDDISFSPVPVLGGVVFTVMGMATFSGEGHIAGTQRFREESLLQVQYDAWAYPFPEVCIFTPGDCVLEVEDES